MKLNEPKVKIVCRGVNPVVDFTFSDNFCPCCGTNCQKVKIEKFTKDGLLFTYYGRQAVTKCPSCGATFQKEVYDSKELISIFEVIFFFSVAILLLSILGIVVFSILQISAGVTISVIMVIISFIICGAAASN